MPIITAIKPQKNKKRVNVYLDDKFSSKGRPASGWGFGLDLGAFVKYGLKVGQELSEREIKKIVKEAEFQKIYDKLLRFSTLRPRSEKELKGWLKKYKVHLSLYKDLFNRLKRLELLNDNKFAAWWVEQRLEFTSKSKKELEFELREKGIDKNTIDDVLFEVEIDEVKIAKELLEKKKYRWEKLPKLEAKKKISDFLARRGFDWQAIKKAIDASHQKD